MKRALIPFFFVICMAVMPLCAAAQNAVAAGAGSFSESVNDVEAEGVVSTLQGGWKTTQMETLSGGAGLSAEAPGAVLEFAFNGAAVAADLVTGKSGGRMAVSVDGNPASVIDLYRGHMSLIAERIALADNLAPGAHTLRIEVLPESNPKGFGTLVVIDTLRVASAPYGVLSGVVECRYNKGLPVTRARVSLISQEGETDLVTDVAGEFVFSALAPGAYALRVSHPGFITQEQADLAVQSGQAQVLPTVLLEENVGARPLTFIRRPLGVRPVIVRPGDTFPIDVAAPDSASEWQATLENPGGAASLELKNAAFDSARGRWTLTVAVPADAVSLLYGLRLHFNGGDDFQPRAVQIVPEFKDSLRVVHLTDVHVYKSENLFDVYRRLADEINLINPDVVVVTGDLTDKNGYTDERWPESDQYPPMLDLWNAYDAPTFIVPGNHDLSPFRYQDDYQRWDRFFDTRDFSFDVGPYHFTAFDDNDTMRSANQEAAHAEDVSPEQLDWIEKDLAAHAGAKMRVLLFHVPLHQTESKVKDLAARHDVKLALYGHLHMNVVDKQPPTTYVQTGAAYDGFYRILNLDNGEVGEMNSKKDGFTAFTLGTVETMARASDDGRSITLKARNSSIMAIPGAAWRVEMPIAQNYTCDGCTIVSRVARGDRTLVRFTFDIPAKGGTTAVITAQ